MLSVRDAGPEYRRRSFPDLSAIFHEPKARAKVPIGFNIVQRLVKEAKGVLHVDTHIGVGTTFSGYIPAARWHALNPVLLDPNSAPAPTASTQAVGRCRQPQRRQ